MKILVISSRDLEKGSTKFRVAQYQSLLNSKNISLEYVRRNEIDAATLEKIHRVDLVFNQKCLIKTGLSRKIIRLAKRTLFDFDDAIYTRPGNPYSWFTGARVSKRLHFWLQNADATITANE